MPRRHSESIGRVPPSRGHPNDRSAVRFYRSFLGGSFMSRRPFFSRRALWLVLVAGFLGGSTAVAQTPTNTWVGTASDNWSNATNWNPAAVPTKPDQHCSPVQCQRLDRLYSHQRCRYPRPLFAPGTDLQLHVQQPDHAGRCRCKRLGVFDYWTVHLPEQRRGGRHQQQHDD